MIVRLTFFLDSNNDSRFSYHCFELHSSLILTSDLVKMMVSLKIFNSTNSLIHKLFDSQ